MTTALRCSSRQAPQVFPATHGATHTAFQPLPGRQRWELHFFHLFIKVPPHPPHPLTPSLPSPPSPPSPPHPLTPSPPSPPHSPHPLIPLTSFCFFTHAVVNSVHNFYRRLIGRFYFYTTAILPAFLASITAILCERKSRSDISPPV